MEKIYRVTASATVKPRGERKFRNVNRAFEVDSSVLNLSKEALQSFAEAHIGLKYGSERVANVRWVEIEEGIRIDDSDYWKE